MLRMLKKIIADRADCDMLDISLDSKFEDLIPNGEEREDTMIYITLDVEDAFDVELPPEAAKWRALALTKKSKLNVTAHIPRRQFMGESRELMQKVNEIINESINRIKNGIHSL